MFLILLLCGFLMAAAAFVGKNCGETLGRPHVRNRGLWTLLAAAVAFGVLRNIPHWPFTLLAPY